MKLVLPKTFLLRFKSRHQTTIVEILRTPGFKEFFINCVKFILAVRLFFWEVDFSKHFLSVQRINQCSVWCRPSASHIRHECTFYIVVGVDWQVLLCRDVTRVNTAVVLWESMWSPVCIFFSRVFYDVGTDSRIVCRRLYSWPSDECKQCFTVVPSSGSPSSSPDHHFKNQNFMCGGGVTPPGGPGAVFKFFFKTLFSFYVLFKSKTKLICTS